MPSQRQEIQRYIDTTLGLKTELVTEKKLKVAFFIRDTYELVTARFPLGDTTSSILLMLPIVDSYPGIVSLKKHIAQLQKATDSIIVYACKTLSANERRSLIKHRICFIQAGYQLFIPDLAIDLREAFRTRRQIQELTALLPAAQAILISCLYRGWSTSMDHTSSELMGNYRYSRATLSKVTAQLQSIEIIEEGKKTNTHRFTNTENDTFHKARPYLRSPIKRKVAIDRPLKPDKYIFFAGETALAHYSTLAAPSLPVFGMTNKHFTALQQQGLFKETIDIDDTHAWVEIWSYRSEAEDTHFADELSLILSLEDDPDERIQIALDEVKENIRWLTSED